MGAATFTAGRQRQCPLLMPVIKKTTPSGGAPMQSIQMNHKQQGFTLIELMIVVAIIGILAAIAIPQYQDYIARSQMNRVFSEVSALKTSAEEMLMRGQELSGDLEAVGYTGSNLIENHNIDNNTGYKLTAELGGNASPAVDGAQIEIIRDEDGQWNCAVTSKGGDGWDASFIPSGCSDSI